MEALYKLPKDMLVKIIDTGFSVDNLNKKECLDMKRKCEKRITKLRTKEIKEYLRNEVSKYFILRKEQYKEEIKKYIDLITEVSIWKEENENTEVIFYAKENFEMSFLVHDDMYWLSENAYIAVYDKKKKEMTNEYYKYANEKVGDNPLSPLTIFHSFILDTVNVACLNKVFEKNFHYP